jgi:flagella basal body P-ring formation protein FlgA
VVTEAIAARWGVDPARVRVAPLRGAEWPEVSSNVKLLGAGADGSWVIAFEDDSGPGSLGVRAGVETNMSVATRDLPRGATLGAEDIGSRRDVRWGPPARDGEEVVAAGWITRRRIKAGEALGSALAEKPAAVVPGQEVRVVWARGDISIAVSGRAAGRAAVGERVAVRADTGRRLEGIVIADGIVHVGPDAGRTP